MSLPFARLFLPRRGSFVHEKARPARDRNEKAPCHAHTARETFERLEPRTNSPLPLLAATVCDDGETSGDEQRELSTPLGRNPRRISPRVASSSAPRASPSTFPWPCRPVGARESVRVEIEEVRDGGEGRGREPIRAIDDGDDEEQISPPPSLPSLSRRSGHSPCRRSPLQSSRASRTRPF